MDQCGETGHMSRDCPQERKPKSCYKCGEEGHLSVRLCSAQCLSEEGKELIAC
ncbi:hypothetical protein BT69DRAFT_1277041 [Atractiella rhizophila]|nr:hypothetical protein BT69DRAFT_1277041 [Atractiella rhizophila]